MSVRTIQLRLATLVVGVLLLAPLAALAAPRNHVNVGPTTETWALIGAGDIASCGSAGDSRTAALVANVLNSNPNATAFTAGDNVYPNGSSKYFANCYTPTWGAFKARTRPVPGNHDYSQNPGAAPYFAYFGSLAGPAGQGWYAFDAGAWRVYALNTECRVDSRCYSRQYEWLKADLAADPRQCVAAIWHRPRWSTGPHGNAARMAQVFKLLYDNGAEVVLNGHDHGYQRFMPANPNGLADVNGVREFVVATGGASLYSFRTTSPILETRDNTTRGVLRLDLSAGSYTWQFLPVRSGGFTDSGTGVCH